MSESSSVLLNMGTEIATAAGARPMAAQTAATGNGNEFANILQSVLPADPPAGAGDPLLAGQVEINALLSGQPGDSANQLLTGDDIDLEALFGGNDLPAGEQGLAWQAMMSEYDSTDPDTPRLLVASGDQDDGLIEEFTPYDILTDNILQASGKPPADNPAGPEQQAGSNIAPTADEDELAGEMTASELAAAMALANRQDAAAAARPEIATGEAENALKLAGLQQAGTQPASAQHVAETGAGKSDSQTGGKAFSIDESALLAGQATADAVDRDNTRMDISASIGADALQAKSNGPATHSSASTLGASTYAAVSGLGAVASTAHTSGPVIASLTVPPQNPAWGDFVGDRVQWMATQNIQEARIRLNPPELGLLEVRVQIGHDHQTTLSFSSPHSQVRDALEHAVPRLREMFGESGLTLGDVNVSHQSMSEQRHPGHGQHSANPSVNKFTNASIEIAEPVQLKRPMINGTGMLDLYA